MQDPFKALGISPVMAAAVNVLNHWPADVLAMISRMLDINASRFSDVQALPHFFVAFSDLTEKVRRGDKKAEDELRDTISYTVKYLGSIGNEIEFTLPGPDQVRALIRGYRKRLAAGMSGEPAASKGETDEDGGVGDGVALLMPDRNKSMIECTHCGRPQVVDLKTGHVYPVESVADGMIQVIRDGEGRRAYVLGAKAFYILEPRFITKVRTDPATGEPVLSEGRPITCQVLAGFRPSPRFRYEDTEGESLEEYRPRQMPPLTNVAEKWGVKVRYENTTRGEQGYFEPGTNSIVLCVEDPSTFFHELAHKAHSKIEQLKPVQDPEQETIAELAACTLSEMYGYDLKGNSYDYIAHYARVHTPEQVGRLCMRVLDRVRKVLDVILRADEEAGVRTAA